MKKIYQSPELQIIKMHVQDSILLNTSDTTVSGENGGWAKQEDSDSWDIWDDVSTTPVNWDE